MNTLFIEDGVNTYTVKYHINLLGELKIISISNTRTGKWIPVEYEKVRKYVLGVTEQHIQELNQKESNNG